MYLSDIEIVGFKSFAQKTKLKFAPGLSAVVGPNGCGKTNVVDAIRWVLGEKKASTLRSDIMENVIFNGTRDRKPLSLAEVSITFDNTKNILPTEYNEIVVTRRLFRSGDSEYLLNKTHCRLKDILDLFMDTGIGSDSYSVIELKMVDAILSGKVDDRRAMFEEAAGIKKYKSRRKESMKKLESVKADMERIQDILQEVRKNVNSLSRQAAKTKKYNQYLTELKSLEIELFAREFSQFNSNKNDVLQKVKDLSGQKIKSEISLSSAEKDIVIQKEKQSEIENLLNTTVDRERGLLKEISELKQNIAVSKEKITSFDTSRKRLFDDIAESESNLKLREDELKSIDLKIESAKSTLSEHSERIKYLVAQRDSALSKVKASEHQVNGVNTEIISLKNKIDSLNNLLNKSKDKKISVERKIQQLAEDKFRFIKQMDELEEDKLRNEKLLPSLREELLSAENDLRLSTEKKASLENDIERVKQQINDKKNALGGKKASLDFLNSLVDNSVTAKFLSDTDNWKSQVERVLLGEIIGTDDEYRLAVLTALGEFAHSFVAESRQSALEAIAALKDKNKGKSGFICLDNIPQINPPENLPNNDGVRAWLSEAVRVDDNIRNVLRGLLGRTLIVENEKSAIEVIGEGKADICVTIDGIMLHSAGIMSGGSVSQKEGQWVGKKERISKLKIEIDIINSEIDLLTNQLKDLTDELGFIEIPKLQQEIRRADGAISENKRKDEQYRLKLESIKTNIEFIEENSDRLQDELSEITIDDSSSEDEINSINDTLVRKQTELLQLKAVLADNHQTLSEKQEVLRNTELEGVELEAEYKTIEADKLRFRNDIFNLGKRIANRKEEADLFDIQKDELDDKITSMSDLLINSENELEDVKSKREVLTTRKKEVYDIFDQLNIEFKVHSKEFDRIKEALHQLEIQETEYNSHIFNITQRAYEQYDTDISTIVIEINPDFDIKNAKSEVHSLREKLSQLGNVNFMALEEYETQNERLEFYEKQMNDLSESEKILRDTIEEINNTAERNFKDTFEKIQTNFRSLFKKLFGDDGQADIHLESDDLLESDIVITAKPPNKRPHSIEMLSGGEKTLTAIALLFAIYLVKPSPFCILDEVDAPLDDANIDKFVGLIKDFSIETQFLIVTHNKKTMEAADTLYGVTMQEDGVSKVVAVKLNSNVA